MLVPAIADKSFLPVLKGIFSGYDVKVCGEMNPQVLTQITDRAQVYGIKKIATSNPQLLKLLVQHHRKVRLNSAPSLDNFEGSFFEAHGCEFVIVPPAKHVMSVNYGSHWYKRLVSKLTNPDRWFPQTEFIWDTIDEFSAKEAYASLQDAPIIAVDIETSRDGLHRILCVNYTGIYYNKTTRQFYTRGYVLPINNMRAVAWMRAFNKLPASKIFQNGKYDNAYFLRYGAPVDNWFYDTLTAFHSWYSEMPKTLDYITAYSIRNMVYWKDQSTVDLYQYNAMDGWATANAWLSLMREMPEWAFGNYSKEFPMSFPCLQADMDGLLVDPEEQARLAITQTVRLDEALASLQAKVGKGFNPSSPPQTKRLLQVLQCHGKPPKPAELAKIDSSDKKMMRTVADQNPLNALIIEDIIEYREARKLLGDYLEAKLLHGRFMYTHNPGGTDTGRLASGNSHFWCGHQIQNMPPYVKQMLIADEGWELCEIDNAQSESRCTAYLSGDEALIAAVDSGRDFHSVNASAFFGIPYGDLWDSLANKTKNKAIRDLSKRTNHGANYNMQEGMLLQTMGTKNVIRAKVLLKLPAAWSLRRVCAYLLEQFDSTYPVLRGEWYDYVKYCVATTKLLVGPTGWTRYCFGDPSRNKRDLNALVAHPPQSLSVMVVNIGFKRIYRELQGPKLRLKAQIHDSVLFQYRKGDLETVRAARACMDNPIEVKDRLGIARTMRIPTDVKGGARKWSDLKTLKL